MSITKTLLNHERRLTRLELLVIISIASNTVLHFIDPIVHYGAFQFP